MSEVMEAVVCHGPYDYQIERVPVPEPGPGAALVKVDAVGICASDIKCYHGAVKFWGDEHRPAYAEREVIPGHEFAGTVVSIDQEASRAVGRGRRGPRRLGADSPLLEMPLLPEGPVLDVRTARPVRLQTTHARGDGLLYGLSARGNCAPDLGRRPCPPRRVR